MKTRIYSKQVSTVGRRRLEIIVLIIGCLGLFYACSSAPDSNTTSDEVRDPSVADLAIPEPPAVPDTDASLSPIGPTGPGTGDFSKFDHGNAFHARLPCLVCHTRETNASRIGFPAKMNHLPCAGCHALQFSDQSSLICTICHTDPQSGAMKSFPPLRNFGLKFNHSKHSRVDCATCHKPERRGVARSIPSGSSAHATCFQCHTSNSANSMASCSVCHEPGRFVRTPTWVAAFRSGFSHAKHAGSGLNCRDCHQVRSGSARGKQVSAPVTSMHFASQKALSCSSCHDGSRAFGADEFSNCKRCHTGSSFRF
jgi:c(7)-type cytochrome triheme protein